MTDLLLSRRDLEFLLYEMLNTEAVLARTPYRDLTRQDMDAVINTAEQTATQSLAKGGFVVAQKHSEDGVLLPTVITAVAHAWFDAAAISQASNPFPFQAKREACIAVGIRAAALACRGYLHALQYARKSPLVESSSNQDALSKPDRPVDHVDIRRMLLTQKTYAEGALALCLYASSLAECSATASDECEQQRAAALLDLLSPVVTTWPIHYGCVSNDLAVQVFGRFDGHGDVVAEQLYQDQRLHRRQNAPEGSSVRDLLSRDSAELNAYAWDVFRQEVRITLQIASSISGLSELTGGLDQALTLLDKVLAKLLADMGKDSEPNSGPGLANATLFVDFFGRIVLAWIWLKQAVAASRAMEKAQSLTDKDSDFYRGKLQTARFYMTWELPQALQQGDCLLSNNRLCFDMRDTWF
jgi:hypothetical protein